jgi:RNA polymerase sigma-70 factor (ECF subfamily)
MAVARPDETSAESPRVETIEELFGALESPLLSYALRLVKDRDAAEDLVQEVFMKLHGEFENVRAPRRWLYRTVHNLALNYQRRAGKTLPIDFNTQEGTSLQPSLEIPDPQPLPDEQIARWENIGLVRLSLATLDARSQELVRLKFSEGLSYDAMAARTGLTSGHVGYLLHHALKAIAAELAKSGGIL